MDIKIEEAGLEHLEEIVTLNHRIFAPIYSWPPYTLEQYSKKLRDKKPLIYVVRKSDIIIADCIAFAIDSSWYIWILGVAPEYRNKRVATKLLATHDGYASSKNFRTVSAKVYNVSTAMQVMLVEREYQAAERVNGKDIYSDAIRFELRL